MNKEALDRLTDGPHLIMHVRDELHILAAAFDETGNEKIAAKLDRLARDLQEAKKLIEEGRNEALNHALRVSEEATGNMLMAAMAGVLGPRPAAEPAHD
jgi:hypothetical protein